jgi:hypothetical protein
MLIMAGCGRIDFNGLGVDGATGIDTPTGDGVAGFGPWSPPRRLTELNSSSDDVNPSISADGLELYFASTRRLVITACTVRRARPRMRSSIRRSS